ncbi:HNH/ENDO VII family nuclease [Mycobacterium hubeiense]|uniref:HNH/ENDO VII family nuclease n=1 Tax=Mycobacterium hubeiense TaxID=1867256 RepID=UPI000C7F55D1|nr:HNH/ENDO VII family nuclease [Mycobacterium sp. QGD 101]
MSPAAAPAVLPTKSRIQNWPSAHLESTAAQLLAWADGSERLFEQHVQNVAAPGGTNWAGSAKDAAYARVTADMEVVRRQSQVQRDGADIASNGADDIQAAQRKALEAIAEAEADGFSVGEDLSVTEARYASPLLRAPAGRQEAALEHAENIRWHAEQLLATDRLVGDRLEAKAAELQGITFEQSGNDGTTQMLDDKRGEDDRHETPVAGAPPDGPMSDAQIKDTIDDLLAGQDLNPAEAQRLSEILRNELHQASANGLSADDAYNSAENAAVAYMAELHRAYVRKHIRLGIFEGTLRTPDGDLLSDVSGDVIPAARDADGDLIWVDKLTGARVAEGTPDSMTVPERGHYHLGHQYGYENWRVLHQAAEEGWTQQEFNDFMNQHGHYRLETPSENLSHAHEDHSPYIPNPAWTPDRLAEATAAGAGTGGGTAPIIAPPPNMPGVLDHPPVAVPPAQGSHPPTPTIPPLAPTPALPPWLTDPGAGHAPGANPLLGPYDVSIDSAPTPATSPTTAWTPPDLSIELPDVHLTPEDAKTGGFLAGVGAAIAILGKVGSSLAHPFG